MIPLKVYTISVLHPKLQNANYTIGLGLEETITLSELGVLIDVFVTEWFFLSAVLFSGCFSQEQREVLLLT